MLLFVYIQSHLSSTLSYIRPELMSKADRRESTIFQNPKLILREKLKNILIILKIYLNPKSIVFFDY